MTTLTFPNVALSALPVVDLLSLVGSGECRFDPELHTGPDVFEDEPVMERLARVDAAKDICESCPVWGACLEYALRTKPLHGVWAGHTVKELADLRESARTAAPTADAA